jgi:Methyltransferase domain
MTARDRLIERLRIALDDATFVKLTLSAPRDRGGLRNVYARIVELKAGRFVSLTLRHPTRDTTRNVTAEESPAQIGSMLADVFGEAHLFTTAGDWKLRANPAGEGTLKASRPSFTAAPPAAHDREKPRALANAPFLVKLGVTGPDGTARPGMADKLRQCERFVELLGHLVNASPLRDARSVRVCDMGAGKGYLTFATHEFFRKRGVVASITGIEERADLVAQTDGIARELGCDGLCFKQGSIADSAGAIGDADLVIALHACDTATDDALAAGIRAGAPLIVVAPCCHKELRPQLSPPPALAAVMHHGILAARQADLLTDGLRALALESLGYEAKVFEFISSEHTAKNLMIAATRSGSEDPAKGGQLQALMAAWGITRFRLAEAVTAARKT